MQTWLVYPLSSLPSMSVPLFVTPETAKRNLPSKDFGVLLRLQICLCSWTPSSQARPFLRPSPQPAFIKIKQEPHFPLVVSLRGIMETPKHANTTCTSSAREYSWGLRRERGGRRGALLGGHTYSGLLFFSSSESELWWWIQLLSPFRVVRTFICLMILLRSSSVGGMTRPRRGRGKGRAGWLRTGKNSECQQVSWGKSRSREHRSLQSEIQTLNESFDTSDERGKAAVIQTSGSIYPQASPPLQRFIRLLLSFQRTPTLMSHFLSGRPTTFSVWSNHLLTKQ